MNLMHFLVATKSLKTVKDAPSPYRMDETNLLPKFAPKKAEPEAAPEASRTKPAEQCVKPIASPVGPVEQVEQVVNSARKQKGWSEFCRIFFRSRPANSKPVQTELSLDAVRVVRSSLCDNERPDEPVGKPAKEQALQKTPSLSGQWWTRLQTRLFAVRRKQTRTG